jgi:RNA polymerase sigma factor (sigma-70 family)
MLFSEPSSNRSKGSKLNQIDVFTNRRFSESDNVCTFSRVADKDTRNPNVAVSSSVTTDANSMKKYRDNVFNQRASLVFEAVRSFKAIAKQTELEDLLQEGFLFLWESLESHNDTNSDPDELLREIKNYLRVKRKDQNSLYRLAEHIIKIDPPSAQLPDRITAELDLIRRCLERAFEKLSPKQKEVLTLCFGLDGQPMKVRDVAELKNLTPRAVRKNRQLGCAVLFEDPDLHSLAS